MRYCTNDPNSEIFSALRVLNNEKSRNSLTLLQKSTIYLVEKSDISERLQNLKNLEILKKLKISKTNLKLENLKN